MVYIEWEDEQLKEYSINKRQLQSVLNQLEKVKERMDKLGLSVYVAAGAIHVIYDDRPPHDEFTEPDHDAVIATVGYGWDGGDW